MIFFLGKDKDDTDRFQSRESLDKQSFSCNVKHLQMHVNKITVFFSSDGVISFFLIICLLLFLYDDDDHYHFSLIDDVHESNYLAYYWLLFYYLLVQRWKSLILKFIYTIYREKKAQMNNQSSIDRFPTVNNNTFCL